MITTQQLEAVLAAITQEEREALIEHGVAVDPTEPLSSLSKKIKNIPQYSFNALGIEVTTNFIQKG